jgi:hypothetical protein
MADMAREDSTVKRGSMTTARRPVFAEIVHPDDRIKPGKTRATTRTVRINLAESPLGWLHARGMLSDRQLLAGEKLRGDYERGGLSAATTMRWDVALAAGAGRGDGGGIAALTHRQIDARRRFHAALDDVGPGLADICWRVICAGDGVPAAEKTLGWPARAGRLVLTLALDRLVRFYGV